MNEYSRTTDIIRRVLLAILVIGLIGTAAELVLLKHTEDVYQWIPIALILLALVAVIWFGAAKSARSIRAVQGVMILFVVSGFVGTALHFKRNVTDARESDPSLSGQALYVEAMMGTTPALAPGTMIQLGLIGLLFTFRHPALRAGQLPRTLTP